MNEAWAAVVAAGIGGLAALVVALLSYARDKRQREAIAEAIDLASKLPGTKESKELVALAKRQMHEYTTREWTKAAYRYMRGMGYLALFFAWVFSSFALISWDSPTGIRVLNIVLFVLAVALLGIGTVFVVYPRERILSPSARLPVFEDDSPPTPPAPSAPARRQRWWS
ncbi:hypothetical protein [Kineococcus terrestris]|uniref:hypothetical protein n=1 Tax=Kineococcus terrestris TaxID=2044856 RepID=UPI0034DB28DF